MRAVSPAKKGVHQKLENAEGYSGWVRNGGAFKCLGVSHFKIGGHSFLFAICRETCKFCEHTKDKSVRETTKETLESFNTYGLPKEIRTDGAPTFSQT